MKRLARIPALLTIALLGTGLPLAASAQSSGQAAALPPFPPPAIDHPYPGMMPPPAGMPRLPPLLHGIGLSETQQDQVFAIVHAVAPALRAKAKALRKAQEEWQAMVLAERYDESKAGALADAIGAASRDIALLQGDTDRKIVALLTPEQRAQIATHLTRHRMPH